MVAKLNYTYHTSGKIYMFFTPNYVQQAELLQNFPNKLTVARKALMINLKLPNIHYILLQGNEAIQSDTK